MMSRLVAILSLSWLLLGGQGARPREVDLRKLDEWAALERSFGEPQRERARAEIAAHLGSGRSFSDAAFYMEVRRIMAQADNGHSNASDEPIYERFGVLPLRTYPFADGLHVVWAAEDQRGLLGARIEQVEGRPLVELERALQAYCGGTREYFRHYVEASLLLCPALMHAIGLAERSDRLRLDLVRPTGEAVSVVLDVDPDSQAVVARPWRLLSPQPFEGAAGWAAVHAADVEPPLWLQQEAQPFRYVLLEDGTLAYVQFRANRDTGSNDIRAFAARTREHLEQDRPHSIVLDCRANGGGDLTTTADFALELPSYVQPGGRVYVLTGNGTFSAGIYTSFYAKASDPEHTVVVGEPVGDRGEFWAEAAGPFQLPDCGLTLGYALQRHDLLRGCTVPVECHMSQYPEHWNLVVESLAPDWPVPLGYADFAAGRDPVLERVLAEHALSH